jgi:hypothetical protein
MKKWNRGTQASAMADLTGFSTMSTMFNKGKSCMDSTTPQKGLTLNNLKASLVPK